MARINSKGSSKTIFLLSQNRRKQTIVRLCSIEISWLEFDKSSFDCLLSLGLGDHLRSKRRVQNNLSRSPYFHEKFIGCVSN